MILGLLVRRYMDGKYICIGFHGNLGHQSSDGIYFYILIDICVRLPKYKHRHTHTYIIYILYILYIIYIYLIYIYICLKYKLWHTYIDIYLHQNMHIYLPIPWFILRWTSLFLINFLVLVCQRESKIRGFETLKKEPNKSWGRVQIPKGVPLADPQGLVPFEQLESPKPIT